MNAPTPALVAPRPERLRLVGQRRQILTMMHQRLMFGLLVYAGVIALIVLRILYLAAFGDHAGAKRGLTALVPERGDIVDRDGQPLARTIDAWTIGLWPRKVIGNKLEIARTLAQLMPERDEATYFAMLRSNKSFFYLRRRARAGLVEAVNAIGEPGLALEREPDRLYPQTSLAAHVIGYTDVDGKGTAGIEWALNDQLSDAATRGQPVQLSISSKVQQALEHELLDAMTHFSAVGAAGHHHGHPLGRGAGDDLASAAQSERCRPGLDGSALQPRDARRLRARLDLQAVHRGHGDGQRHRPLDGPDLQLPEPAQRLRADDQRHPSLRPRLHRRRDHEGKLEHRHGADRGAAGRNAAERVPRQDGLPRPGRDRAAGKGADADRRATTGARWRR